MNMWLLLGIERTEDISVIKKAYAQKLTLYHPEVDAAGYQKLREAYDGAIKYAKQMQQKRKDADLYQSIESIMSTGPIDPIDPTDPIDLIDSIDPIGSPSTNFDPRPPPITSETKEKKIENTVVDETSDTGFDLFLEKLRLLYDDFFERIHLENWKTLLNDDAMWHYTHRQILEGKVLEFLVTHHQLPQNVWQLLDSYFQWTQADNAPILSNNQQFFTYIVNQVKNKNPLDFYHIERIPGFDYETFLHHREKAWIALHENNFNVALYHSDKAKALYQKDGFLEYIIATCHIQYKKYDQAFNALQRLLPLLQNGQIGLPSESEIQALCKKCQEEIEMDEKHTATKQQDSEGQSDDLSRFNSSESLQENQTFSEELFKMNKTDTNQRETEEQDNRVIASEPSSKTSGIRRAISIIVSILVILTIGARVYRITGRISNVANHNVPENVLQLSDDTFSKPTVTKINLLDETPSFPVKNTSTYTPMPSYTSMPANTNKVPNNTGWSNTTDRYYNAKPLKIGDKGEDIAVVQAFLDKAGYYKLLIDGEFGAKTKDAVIRWQVDYNKKNPTNIIITDGTVGKQTWSVMGFTVNMIGWVESKSDTMYAQLLEYAKSKGFNR